MALSEQDILAGLAEIVNEETGLPTDAVELDKYFTDDLDIDSLSMMTNVTLAEEKLEVRIPDEDVQNLSTVGDAVAYITKAQASPRLVPAAGLLRGQAARRSTGRSPVLSEAVA